MTNREEIQRDLLLSALNCGGSDLNKLLEIIEKGVNTKFTLEDEEVYLLPYNWSSEVFNCREDDNKDINFLISCTFEKIRGAIDAQIPDYNAIDYIDTEINFMCSSMSFDKERFLEANNVPEGDENGELHGEDYTAEEIESGLNEEHAKIKRIADEIETIINEF